MYGSLGMSTSSLHRESSDSVMIFTLVKPFKHAQDTVGSLASLNGIAR